jgi:hypothetical protein
MYFGYIPSYEESYGTYSEHHHQFEIFDYSQEYVKYQNGKESSKSCYHDICIGNQSNYYIPREVKGMPNDIKMMEEEQHNSSDE